MSTNWICRANNICQRVCSLFLFFLVGGMHSSNEIRIQRRFVQGKNGLAFAWVKLSDCNIRQVSPRGKYYNEGFIRQYDGCTYSSWKILYFDIFQQVFLNQLYRKDPAEGKLLLLQLRDTIYLSSSNFYRTYLVSATFFLVNPIHKRDTTTSRSYCCVLADLSCQHFVGT